jgi:hypothetical protein
MVLDHDSGRMEGRCLKGRFAGQDLSSLTESQLVQVLSELRSADSQGAVLMEAYLDRRSRDWRSRDSDDGARPKHVGSTLVAQRQVNGAASYSKINVLRCSPCVDIAGVTGSIPVAPTTLSRR